MAKLENTENFTFIQLQNSQFTDPSTIQDMMIELSKLSDEDAAKRINTEETLQRLRLTNSDILYLKDKKQLEEAYQQSLTLQEKVLAREREAKKKLLSDEYEDKISNIQATSEEEFKEKQDLLQKEFNMRQKAIDDEWKEKNKKMLKATEDEFKARKKKIAQEYNDAQHRTQSGLFALGVSWSDRKNAWSNIGKRKNKDGDEVRNPATIADDLIKGLATIAKKLNNQIDEIAGRKGAIDTRLQGSKNNTKFGSYWDRMSDDLVSVAGISPYIKQSAVVEKISAMVDKGISFNVEQRAVLDTLKDKIATTFDATNGTLLRLIRVQQQDTTAARLGMESALTAFLNNMYETTEYMKDLATSVKGSLEEAMSLMSGENALSFEYQVQKWLGSLYSVGMNQSSAQNLANVIGQLAAGQLEGLTGGKASNLAIMAANRANISIADIMAKGLDESATNKLMEAMVEYLGDIYNETKESKVVQQQYAQIFGMSASDLKAVANLAKSTKNVSSNKLNYNEAIGRLYDMTGTIGSRTSLGEGISNVKNNLLYSLAEGIASSPALYALNTMSNLLDTFVGGMPIPFVETLLGGVDVHTTIADLLRVGAFSSSIIGTMGKMINSSLGGANATGILDRYGLSDKKASFVSRGTGTNLSTMSGLTVSSSGTTAANGSGDDLVNKTLTDNADNSNQQLANAVDDQDDVTIRTVNESVLSIHKLLRDVADGTETLHVTEVERFGIH